MNKIQLIVVWILSFIFLCLNVNLAQPDLEVDGIFYEEKGQSYAIVNGEVVKVGSKIKEVEVYEIKEGLIKFKYGEEILIKKVGSGEAREQKRLEKQQELKEFDGFLSQNNIKRISVEGKDYFFTKGQAKQIKEGQVSDWLCKIYSDTTKRRAEYCFQNRVNLDSEKIRLILNGKIRIGMNQEEVIASWGKPRDINRTVSQYLIHEQWVYGNNKYLYFESGVLRSWQD